MRGAGRLRRIAAPSHPIAPSPYPPLHVSPERQLLRVRREVDLVPQVWDPQPADVMPNQRYRCHQRHQPIAVVLDQFQQLRARVGVQLVGTSEAMDASEARRFSASVRTGEDGGFTLTGFPRGAVRVEAVFGYPEQVWKLVRMVDAPGSGLELVFADDGKR